MHAQVTVMLIIATRCSEGMPVDMAEKSATRRSDEMPEDLTEENATRRSNEIPGARAEECATRRSDEIPVDSGVELPLDVAMKCQLV